MEITLARLLGFLTGSFFLYISYIQFKKKLFKKSDLIGWTIVWGGLIVISLLSVYAPLSQTIIFSYRFIDLVLVFSILIGFTIIFLIYKRLKKYEKKTKELVRKVAIKKK